MFAYYGPGLWLYRTWLSVGDEIPEDFPAEFSVDDFEPADNDADSMNRVQRQKDFLDATRGVFVTHSDEEWEAIQEKNKG